MLRHFPAFLVIFLAGCCARISALLEQSLSHAECEDSSCYEVSSAEKSLLQLRALQSPLKSEDKSLKLAHTDRDYNHQGNHVPEEDKEEDSDAKPSTIEVTARARRRHHSHHHTTHTIIHPRKHQGHHHTTKRAARSKFLASMPSRIRISMLAQHSDGASMYGLLSGLALAEQLRIAYHTISQTDTIFEVAHPCNDFGIGHTSECSTNIFSNSSWSQTLNAIGFGVAIERTPEEDSQPKIAVCVDSDILPVSGVPSSCASPVTDDGQEGTSNLKFSSSYLWRLPRRLAEFCSCIIENTDGHWADIDLRLLLVGGNVGSPLYHAYYFYNGWNFTRNEWNMLEFSAANAATPFNTTCAYWFRPETAGCNAAETVPVLHSELQRAKIDCILINALGDETYDLPGITQLAVAGKPKDSSAWTTGDANFEQMEFATKSSLFITEAGSHWPDMVLGIRGHNKRRSIIINCPDSYMMKPSLKPNEPFRLEYSEQCVNNGFRRARCVEKPDEFMEHVYNLEFYHIPWCHK